MIPVYIFTNDNHLWLLRGFSYLWNEYCDRSQRVTIVGFNSPGFDLPDNFRFYSLGNQQPANRWSDALLDFLDQVGHKYFILMLEDYWLIDNVDRLVINRLENYMDDDILRIDLSGNRASYSHKSLKTDVLGCQLIESVPTAKYQMSYQAAIWNKHNLRKVLKKGENPWQSEINGSKRIGNLRVLGTYQPVMRYQPVWRSKQKRWQLDKIPTDKLDYIKSQGWLDASRET